MPILRKSDLPQTAEAFDPTAMLARIGAGVSFFAELVEIFLEEYPPLIDEIRLTIAKNDAMRLKYAAHTLRGAIGNFTDGKPYEIADQLESMAETNNLKDARDALDSLVEDVDQFASALKLGVSQWAP